MSLLRWGLRSRLLGHVLDMDSKGSAWFLRGTVGVSRLPVSAVSGYEGSRNEPGGVELVGREKVRSAPPDGRRLVLGKPVEESQTLSTSSSRTNLFVYKLFCQLCTETFDKITLNCHLNIFLKADHTFLRLGGMGCFENVWIRVQTPAAAQSTQRPAGQARRLKSFWWTWTRTEDRTVIWAFSGLNSCFHHFIVVKCYWCLNKITCSSPFASYNQFNKRTDGPLGSVHLSASALKTRLKIVLTVSGSSVLTEFNRWARIFTAHLLEHTGDRQINTHEFIVCLVQRRFWSKPHETFLRDLTDPHRHTQQKNFKTAQSLENQWSSTDRTARTHALPQCVCFQNKCLNIF